MKHDNASLNTMQVRQSQNADFARRLLDWFDQHGRHDLPWQHPRTPYRVWLSEIMLQQTQVTTVINYFNRFISRFPEVCHLAAAPLDEVLKLWEGLGYYARARNLHRSAREIAALGGVFPDTQEALEALPGIGRSTAGAILAMGFGKRATILDGNVKRVLCRHEAVREPPLKAATLKALWASAEAYTPQQRVCDYTQAIMDLGATLCTRSRPRCAECPLQMSCQAFRLGMTEQLPARAPRKAKPTRHRIAWHLQRPDGKLFLERRPESGIWGGLWSLPEAPEELLLEEALDQARESGILPDGPPPTTGSLIRHTFTHYHLELQTVTMPVHEDFHPKSLSGDWFHHDEALPGLPAPISQWITQRTP